MTSESTTPEQPQGKPKRAKTRLLLVTIAAAVAVLLGTGGFILSKALSPGEFRIIGDLTITGPGLQWGTNSGRCRGDGGYNDINERMNIVITDASGTTVAVGSLKEEGKVTKRESVIKPSACRWEFEITGIPEGSKFYGVAIGRRGTIQYQRDQLNEPLHLTLG